MPNSVLDRLQAQRAASLAAIATAANSGDAAKVLELTEQLRRADQLLLQHDSFIADVEALLDSSTHQVSRPSQSPTSGNGTSIQATGRGHGIEIRSGFLKKAMGKGLKLHPFQGAIYKTPRGVRVGIAVATERQPNRWFLGLGDGGFDAAVLLCQTKGGRTLDVCLPRAFVQSHRAHFSRSRGQEKFNVVRRDGHLHLTIPGVGHVPIDQHVGAIERLEVS